MKLSLRNKKTTTIIFISIFSFLGFMQIFQTNTNNKGSLSDDDFLSTLHAPKQIKVLLKNACYDCHSNTTNYKWYDYIAPISWWVNRNISNGKKALNFEEFKNCEDWQKLSIISACIFNIETDKMPPPKYLLMRPKNTFSKKDKAKIIHWMQSINRVNLN